MMTSFTCFSCTLIVTSVLVNELVEESDQFRFLRVDCLVNLKGSVVMTHDVG